MYNTQRGFDLSAGRWNKGAVQDAIFKISIGDYLGGGHPRRSLFGGITCLDSEGLGLISAGGCKFRRVPPFYVFCRCGKELNEELGVRRLTYMRCPVLKEITLEWHCWNPRRLLREP